MSRIDPRCWPYGGAAFDPATLLPDWWIRAPFAGVNWVATTPGTVPGNLTTKGVAPTVGTGTAIVNGLAAATMNGTTQALQGVDANSSTKAFSGLSTNFQPMTALAVFRDRVPKAPASVFYSEAGVICDSISHWGISSSTSGIRFGAWGGGDSATPYIPVAANTWMMAAARCVDGVAMKCRVSQASGTTDQTATRTAGAGIQRGGIAIVGVSYDSTKWLAGDYLEVMGWKRELADAELVQLRDLYFNSRYGLGFT